MNKTIDEKAALGLDEPSPEKVYVWRAGVVQKLPAGTGIHCTRFPSYEEALIARERATPIIEIVTEHPVKQSLAEAIANACSIGAKYLLIQDADGNTLARYPV